MPPRGPSTSIAMAGPLRRTCDPGTGPHVVAFHFLPFPLRAFALFFSLVKWMWIPDFLQGKTLATFVKKTLATD
jgi:hypothetical protein